MSSSAQSRPPKYVHVPACTFNRSSLLDRFDSFSQTAHEPKPTSALSRRSRSCPACRHSTRCAAVGPDGATIFFCCDAGTSVMGRWSTRTASLLNTDRVVMQLAGLGRGPVAHRFMRRPNCGLGAGRRVGRHTKMVRVSRITPREGPGIPSHAAHRACTRTRASLPSFSPLAGRSG